jgi:hypothetical protein
MKFSPQNFKFVFSLVNGDSNHEKIANASEWLKYWLKFQILLDSKGSVIFDIDDTLVDKDEKNIQSMVDIYHFCIKHNFVVNIITARPDIVTEFRSTKHCT